MSSPFRARNLVAVVALLLASCQREARDYQNPPNPPVPTTGVSPTDLWAGGQPRPAPHTAEGAAYEGNAVHISQGKRWYEAYNCYGCHAAGGGDIGPPLMDDEWRYGSAIEQIYASIEQGRPNGMPSFFGRATPTQIWELAAYVRSMSGQADKLAAPSRDDGMRTTPPLNNVNRQTSSATDAEPQ